MTMRSAFTFLLARICFTLKVNRVDFVRSVAFLLLFLPALGIGAARADAIDGDWCNEVSGVHLRIDGTTIELEAGLTVQGDYSRHAFSYLAPQGALEAGAKIDYVLRSEDQMRRVREGNAMPEHEDLWRRCQPIS